MRCSSDIYDAVIIGGGFYGSAIAIYLAKERGFKRILLIEKESKLLSRASYNNQARVHNGYHYPRSFTTAYRSRINLPKFVCDWEDAVKRDFHKLYAISRRNSKVTAKQFERFCKEIGAKLEIAPKNFTDLFNPRLIENVYLVEEFAFDATILASWAESELKVNGIEINFGTVVKSISKSDFSALCIGCLSHEDEVFSVESKYVFNCTYSGLNQFTGDFGGIKNQLKHEITEMVLLDLPVKLRSLGITVMDGPFFSVMPFPAQGLHTLSHVRYTPHCSWFDQAGVDPYKKLSDYHFISRLERIRRDVARYLPVIEDSKYSSSLLEVKTILIKNEGDDGRPILFEKHDDLTGCYSILGGKIDNIYDVLEKLGEEDFSAIR
ncbi:FAD-dependent oxidoreductase [Leeia oryzae]|uniref:FAD-dependent oxidoreductase n=1 Tax=Leeia oryzae TaxID=356662 RepID=UPI0003A431CB|nr:FAD-dependent oxidoreductase [Leeia oryzae]